MKFRYPPTKAAVLHLKNMSRRNEAKESEGLFQNAFFFESGRAALKFLLITLSKRSGKRVVLISENCCKSVVQAIKEAGLEIRFIRCSCRPFYVTKELIQKNIQIDILAYISINSFGLIDETEGIRQALHLYNIVWIEDLTWIIKYSSNSSSPVRCGDFSFGSFGPGKVITLGGGGFLVSNDKLYISDISKNYNNLPLGNPQLKWWLIRKTYGAITSRYLYSFLSHVRSVLGQTKWLDKKDQTIAVRKLSKNLNEGIRLNINVIIKTTINGAAQDYYNEHINFDLFDSGRHERSQSPKYPIICKSYRQREELIRRIEIVGVHVGRGYDEVSNGIFIKEDDCLEKRIMTIPAYGDLPLSVVKKIVDAINEIK